jgi:hypothetical protein
MLFPRHPIKVPVAQEGVATDVGGITNDMKDNPSLLLRGNPPKEKTTPADKNALGHGS